ncbi:hypothetical protein LFU01_18900 [Lysinibacillus fusiformis]|nr:hypothetical protein LFU01_18900 [Lysinibacillus fusiformis]
MSETDIITLFVLLYITCVILYIFKRRLNMDDIQLIFARNLKAIREREIKPREGIATKRG